MSEPNKFEKAAALIHALRKLDDKHDAKCRKIESRAANQKLDAAALLDQERGALLDTADPEVRAMVAEELARNA